MDTHSGSYVFDSRKETWEHEHTDWIMVILKLLKNTRVFLLAWISLQNNLLLVGWIRMEYPPGRPIRSYVLELDMIFGRGFDPMNDDIFIGKCEGGRMWLVNSYEGPEAPGACSSCVVVFEFS